MNRLITARADEMSLTFEQRLAEYRKGLEQRELVEEYMDSLDGRGGICASDAAEEYLEEVERIEAGESILGLTADDVGDGWFRSAA